VIHFYFFLGALLVAFLARMWLIHSDKRLKNHVDGDASVHLKIVEACRNGVRHIPNYVIPNEMSYPVLFHQFCALFSRKVLITKSYLPNFVLYMLMVAIIYLYISYVGGEYISNYPEWGSFVVIIFFVTTIQNFTSVGPSIAYSMLSSRLLGKVGVSLFTLGFGFYIAFDDIVSLVVGVLGAAIGFLASTFAAQVLLFSAVLLSFTLVSIIPSTMVLAGLFVAIIFSRGYAWKSVTSMMKYWLIYQKLVSNSRYMKAAFSHYSGLPQLLDSLLHPEFKKIARILLFSEPFRSLVFYPELILVCIWLVFNGNTQDPLLNVSSHILFSGLSLYLLTSTKAFNFLGESYRYLEYSLSAIVPSLLFLMFFEYKDSQLALAIFGLYLVYVLSTSQILQKNLIDRPASQKSPLKEDSLTRFIGDLGATESDVIFPVSMRLGADIVARLNCKSFWWQPGAITEMGLYKKYIHEYPYLSIEWETLARKHSVTLVVASKDALARFEDTYDFSGLKLALESDEYVAYRYHDSKKSQNHS